ncbi:cardiolipin synthase [Sphingobacterium nematocida]|uniref:Cardiolipin synthase n=1 Tax=Sphingobacterium nematocida TaxID=1513896 RepID=A0A1T5C9U1_9SPHI|nr:cardiolipin synthase [Sphingobacterium nematocida]SKB56195.1 cardiolipin synthase [Sphingobacterium nematocida]
MEGLKPFIDFALSWYWVPLLILYIGVISAILIENRNPSKTIAWILVIIFIPFLGLILYYFFGQKFVKVQKIKKINKQQARRLEKQWELLDPVMESFIQNIHDEIGDLSKVFRLMKRERLSSPTLNNDVRLLVNGEEKFEALKVDLRQAKHSIHMEYYIFQPDHVGLDILNILEEKAAEGVVVRLIVDSFGSPDLIKYMRRNKGSRIDFHAFLPVTFTSLANSNYRNHRKIVVIDGVVGYVGGINISDRYSNTSANRKATYWRDISLRIEGLAINMLQINFWSSWNQTDGAPFLLEDGYLHMIRENRTESGEAGVGFVSSDPASVGPFNMEAMLIAIGEANQHVRLCTPYYIPSEELERALIIAAASGVKVELMIPATSDSYFVQHASFSFLKPLLERGVEVLLYQKGFLHAKTMTVDGKLTFIGTVNLDIRSFYINYEIAAVVSDSTLCLQSEKQFDLDKQDCVVLTLEDWKNRPRWKRGADSICRLMAPLL